MAQHPEKAPPAPVLLAPREAAVIDGAEVTFRWEPVEGATTYRLEVAADTAFENILFGEEVGDQTSVRLTNAFPEDGETYYWRVLAGSEAGWSNGDNIESFVGSTPEMAAQHLERPDEKYGPYPELITSTAVEAAAEATGSDRLYEEEEEVGVEHEGVEAGQVLGLAFAILAAVILIIILVFFWVSQVEQTARYEAATISQFPERQQLETAGEQELTGYGVVDPEEEIFRIPIQRAMELMIEEAQGQEPGSYSAELPVLFDAPEEGAPEGSEQNQPTEDQEPAGSN